MGVAELQRSCRVVLRVVAEEPYEVVEHHGDGRLILSVPSERSLDGDDCRSCDDRTLNVS